MTTVPTKIVLKSTTRMSLHDRFSSITPTIQNLRANMAAEQQVSAANRRLAQQLANRPGIQSNVGDMYYQQRGGRQGNPNLGMKKKTMQQRLGKGNVKNRLSLPGGQQIRGRGRGRGRGGPNIPNQVISGGDNLYFTNKNRGRGSPRGRGNFRGGRGRGNFNRFEENSRGRDMRRRGGGRGRGGPNRFTGQNVQNKRGGGFRGQGRGMRRGGRFQGRGGPRGRGGRGGNGSVSTQDLDNQLEEYMAKTKSHLDTELDAYMAETTN